MGGSKWMKRWAVIVISSVILMALLASCGEKAVDPVQVVEQADKPFESTATVEYKDIKADIRILREGENLYEVEILNPAPLKGMSFAYNGDKLTVQYLGLAFQVDPASLPVQAMAKVLMNTIESGLDEQGIQVEKKDELYLVSGSGESGNFSMTLDTATGSIVELEVPNENLKVYFENFSFLPQ